MLKQVVALIMLLAVIMQTSSNTFIVFSYYINTASFVKNCENKTRPQLHCNGRCQMVKKLKYEEKRNSQGLERKGINEVNSCTSFFSMFAPPVINKERTHFLVIDDTGYREMPRACFHPPCA